MFPLKITVQVVIQGSAVKKQAAMIELHSIKDTNQYAQCKYVKGFLEI